MIVLKFILLIIGSYLLGSIMFARLLSRLEKTDITKKDSGNPGASNMLRNHGVIFGFITFFLDALKGATACLVGFFLFGGVDGGMLAKVALYVAGISAILGHVFPIYFKFKGGKGVATAAGLVFVAHPWIGLILFACYIVLLIITKIGSLSSLIVAFLYLITDTILLIIDKNFISLAILYVIVGLIVWGHRSNIKRLVEKRENITDLKAALEKDKARIKNLKEKHRNKNSDNDKNSQIDEDK